MNEVLNRVIKEQEELGENAKKLSNFIGLSDVFLKLSDTEKALMKEQCETMWEYYEILGSRISLMKERG